MKTYFNTYCHRFCLFTLLLALTTGCKNKVTLEKTTTLGNYAAGSAIAYINGHLYLVGDNMGYLQVLDTSFNVIDSITILDTVQSPMAQKTKPDIEAAAVVKHNGTDALLVIGSGSMDPFRNRGWLIDLATKEKTAIDLLPFYNRLKAKGLNDLNIEGAAATKENLILSNRGNKTVPQNYLIFTAADFWNGLETAGITIAKIGKTSDGEVFSGVSGLEYSEVSDCLLLTVSTEDTHTSYTDGVIGKSYLWMVNNISAKKTGTTIMPDRIIDLEAIDARFKGEKIETACILSETLQEMTLVLAADNDGASTTLFRLKIRK